LTKCFSQAPTAAITDYELTEGSVRKHDQLYNYDLIYNIGTSQDICVSQLQFSFLTTSFMQYLQAYKSCEHKTALRLPGQEFGINNLAYMPRQI
jgi:hypothetical protein